MDQAWLDSLSEDWVSQPRSSGSPAPSLPSMASSTSDSRVMSSRIPKYNHRKQSWSPDVDTHKPLAERSPSDNNVRSSRAVARPSKLRRSLSASSVQSAPFDTIQHNKSVSVSPQKGPKETPEWKKRLLNGDVAYGEQRDLFAPAGLESMFAPPPSQTPSPTKLPSNTFQEHSAYMPSSPPPYNRQQVHTSEETKTQEVAHEFRNRQQPRAMKYTRAEVDVPESEFSANDLSRSSSFRPGMLRNADQLSDASSMLEHAILPNGDLMRGAVRMVSGQSDMRNEELSPIFVSRHNTMEGGIDYAALDIPPEELQQRLETLRTSKNHQAAAIPQEPPSFESQQLADLGNFVNLRRGGLSHEGSFQKRLLSPSSLPAMDESALLPEGSMQASTPKQLPNIKKTRPSKEYKTQEAEVSPPGPQTPHSSPSKSAKKAEKSNSGSPLKLFGTYDTFTNQKLLRRLSQFEERFEESTDIEMPSMSGEATRPEVNEAFVAESSPNKPSQVNSTQKKQARKFSSFGEGELDEFQFSEAVSYDPYDSKSEEEDKGNGSLPVLNPKTQTRFTFQLDPSPTLGDGAFEERRTKYVNTTSTTKETVTIRTTTRPGTGSSEDVSGVPVSQLIENLETPRKRNGDSKGKRLPKSPPKDPTSKRRRTLQKTDFDDDELAGTDWGLDILNDAHQQMQSVIGKKRKDARHGDDQQAANPKVLALRQILRPRTPTPSQRSDSLQDRPSIHELEVTAEQELLQREKLAKFQAELDVPESLKLSTALGIGQQMLNESRKGSVTTQDFLDEAKKIMAGIRDKARPRSGLASVEESESEIDRDKAPSPEGEEFYSESYQESTQEPFSRPPSREGAAPLQRLPLRQDNPELLDHLRKYQEISDMDGIIGSSVKSIAAAKEAVATARELKRMTEETLSRASIIRRKSQEKILESEPPNIRISENPEMLRKRKHSASSGLTNGEDRPEAEFLSQGSTSSSVSTAHSIPTGSSRNSDSRRIIAPHTVSHLIPEQLAGMVFDRERNIWVKRKSTGDELSGSRDDSPSDETEDDPFGDIPDLSVDETQELHRIKAVAAKRKEEEERIARFNQANVHPHMPNLDQQPPYHQAQAPHGGSNQEYEPSSEPSKLTQFTSSAATTVEANTRVTSWGDDQASAAKPPASTAKSQKAVQRQISTKVEIREEVVEEVEREVSSDQDRVKHSTPRQKRNVTISFSSPIASVIEPSPYGGGGDTPQTSGATSQSEDESEQDFGDESVIIHKRESRGTKVNSIRKRMAHRSTSTRLSVGGHTFPARPVSRIDECDEESINRDNDDRNERSVSVIVATPLPSRRVSCVVAATPRPMHELGTLSLTPMSDFTVHKAEQSFGLEISYVAGSQRYISGDNSKRTLSHSIKQLVEVITEVEPYEPFWEHLKGIELSDKRLTNLHKLDEFCGELEELDISHNQISQLNGAPKGLRHLHIAHNCLSNLTAWGHLSNLQCVDVSNNGLESLSGFQKLVHLRDLRADNNKIKSLDGIRNLDGLISLRMRGNLLESLDFTGTKLVQLADLDLRDNRIRDVASLQELRSLSTINLENNSISSLSIKQSDTLKYMMLSDNNLESIDVSNCPNLRSLHLDRNRLGKIVGIRNTKYLDSLSTREQQDGAIIDPTILDNAYEIRKLFLSGNLLTTVSPHVDFLNLQSLELANCGLESLPAEFGQLVANTRVLNLNFNALKDIKPLVGIIRLKKLYLAGNRLTRMRKTAGVLTQLETLSIVDLRSNPLTQGFYSPVLENQLRRNVENDEVDKSELFTLGKADRQKDVKYAARLDMATKMLRRVYEKLVLGGCSRLKMLDGLTVDRAAVDANDAVCESLLSAGILEVTAQQVDLGKHGQETQQSEPAPKPEKSSIWQGEDSFA